MNRRRLQRALAVGTSALLLALGIYLAGYMPGSIRLDQDGVMHGTGRWTYRYDAGPLMLEEDYLAGHLRFSRWFRPDGSVVAETRWRHGNGTAYYLRQDGTVHTKMEFRGQQAHGPAVYFKEDGVTVDHIVEYRDGKKLEIKK